MRNDRAREEDKRMRGRGEGDFFRNPPNEINHSQAFEAADKMCLLGFRPRVDVRYRKQAVY